MVCFSFVSLVKSEGYTLRCWITSRYQSAQLPYNQCNFTIYTRSRPRTADTSLGGLKARASTRTYCSNVLFFPQVSLFTLFILLIYWCNLPKCIFIHHYILFTINLLTQSLFYCIFFPLCVVQKNPFLNKTRSLKRSSLYFNSNLAFVERKYICLLIKRNLLRLVPLNKHFVLPHEAKYFEFSCAVEWSSAVTELNALQLTAKARVGQVLQILWTSL